MTNNQVNLILVWMCFISFLYQIITLKETDLFPLITNVLLELLPNTRIETSTVWQRLAFGLGLDKVMALIKSSFRKITRQWPTNRYESFSFLLTCLSRNKLFPYIAEWDVYKKVLHPCGCWNFTYSFSFIARYKFWRWK